LRYVVSVDEVPIAIQRNPRAPATSGKEPTAVYTDRLACHKAVAYKQQDDLCDLFSQADASDGDPIDDAGLDQRPAHLGVDQAWAMALTVTPSGASRAA
jgi:hypothetical protein